MDSHTIEVIGHTGQGAFTAAAFVALAGGFVALLLQIGFGLLTTGMVRAKNAAHTMASGVMTFSAGLLGYWATGFALQAGGHGHDIGLGGHSSWLVGWGFFPNVAAGPYGAIALVLGGVAALVPATIPLGAIAERTKLSAWTVFAFIVTAVIYPVFAGWSWHDGWLSDLGRRFGLGHGLVDCAGSGVVHMTGGVLALVAAKMVGSRLGKFGVRGDVRPIPAHSVPLAVLGTALLVSAWFVLAVVLSVLGSGADAGVVTANTLLACAAGGMVAFLHTRLRFGRPDLTMMCNGVLAGLVAMGASGSFIGTASAGLVGAVASLLAIEGALWAERRLKLDDPVGAFAVHGIGGAWGLIAVGLFADGRSGAGLHGVVGPVRGLVAGSAGQLVASLLGVAANLMWVLPVALVSLAILNKAIGLRASADDEIGGLDVPELGMTGYVTEAVGGNPGRAGKPTRDAWRS
ncbi:MAG: ammonium transporter [Polyangia bacterium]|jgi:Amt family ammonium transporter